MNQTNRLSAIEYIRKIMEKYWRGIGAQDEKLVRSVLAKMLKTTRIERCWGEVN